MGTTADKLNAVLASKNAIKAAISEKTGGDAGDVMSTYAEQIRNISSGGGGGIVSKPSKDVNFYDYDGTILYSYTIDEAKALTDLPAGPQHEGLTFDGWNYTLDEIKLEDEMCDVGAMYVTDDGKTRLYITTYIDAFDVSLAYYQTNANGATVNWGDGTTTTNSAAGNVLITHEYATAGDYIITIEVTAGTINLGRSNSSYNVMGSIGNVYRAGIATLRKVEIGANVKSFTGYCFYYCVNLETIAIPRVMTEVANYCFGYDYSLKHVNIPRVANLGTYVCSNAFALKSVSLAPTISTLGNYCFDSCSALSRLNIPNKVTSIATYVARYTRALIRLSLSPNIADIGTYSFSQCYSLTKFKAPANLTSIKANAFNGCYCIMEYDFTECTVVPTLAATSAFTNTHSSSKFLVPASLVDEWKAATYWSTYATRIVGVE